MTRGKNSDTHLPPVWTTGTRYDHTRSKTFLRDFVAIRYTVSCILQPVRSTKWRDPLEQLQNVLFDWLGSSLFRAGRRCPGLPFPGETKGIFEGSVG